MESEVEGLLGKNLEFDSLKTFHVHICPSTSVLNPEFVNLDEENNCMFISSNVEIEYFL